MAEPPLAPMPEPPAAPVCDLCQFRLADLAYHGRARFASGYCEHRGGAAVVVELDRDWRHTGTWFLEAPAEHAERARRRLERRVAGWFKRWRNVVAA